VPLLDLPQPDYSIQGRTVASLLRQVEEWHWEMGRGPGAPALVWPRSSIRGLHYVETTEQTGPVRCWTVRELLTSRELFLEGQAMQHCVASYARLCAGRGATIWSLAVDVGMGPRRVLTVDVEPATRSIRQARGKANRLPRPAELAVLHEWATRERLQFATQL
jgi:hypothetical protein